MPLIRKQLKPSDVYPDNIRYNTTTGTVQTRINDEWVDSPEADPRDQTVFPPRVTSDPNCDAAESIKDAFRGQIDGVLTAIDNSQTVFTIAGIILSFLAFGPFGIFISLALLLAHVMLDAGTISIEAVMTEATYDTFVCILYCHMETNGRLEEGSLGAIDSELDDQVGGLGAVILKAMAGLAGEGGMNNLASLGSSTGDCSDCDCGGCERLWDFTITDEYEGVTIVWGEEVIGQGVEINHPVPPFNDFYAQIVFVFDEPCTARYLEITSFFTTGSSGGGANNFQVATERDGMGELVWLSPSGSWTMPNGSGNTGPMIFTPDIEPTPRLAFRINVWDGGYQTGGAYIRTAELRNEE